MNFDPQVHKDRIILIECARIRRRLKGLPAEGNITVLYNEICEILGLPLAEISSKDADHLPAPHEMVMPDGKKFKNPSKVCPKCGKTSFLSDICQSCKDAENGKYRSGYICDERFDGCGFIDEKTHEFFSQRLSRMGIEVPEGMKNALGIKTITDEGIK